MEQREISKAALVFILGADFHKTLEGFGTS